MGYLRFWGMACNSQVRRREPGGMSVKITTAKWVWTERVYGVEHCVDASVQLSEVNPSLAVPIGIISYCELDEPKIYHVGVGSITVGICTNFGDAKGALCRWWKEFAESGVFTRESDVQRLALHPI